MKRNKSRSGQALVMVTMSLTLMIGMLGLAVDMGWGYFRREAAQTAADAAAAAVVQAAMASSPNSQSCGSNNVWCGSPAGTATACPDTPPASPVTSFDYGCALALANGFANSAGGSQTVTIQANATSSAPNVPGTAVSYWATVRISENAVPFFCAPGGGGGLLSSSAVTTAGVTSTPGTISNTCLYVLSPSGTDAFEIANGASVKTSSCGIYVNSNAATAMQVTGGATVTSSSVKVVGGVSVSNGGSISSTPATGVGSVADPLISLPSLTPASSCNSGNYTNWQAVPYALTAGTYCGLSVGNGMSAVLGAGNYIINGGTFSVQGGSTLTATSGVLIYLTNGATVNIANGANVTMSPQTSGSYQGVLFFQDRSMTSPGSSTFAGGASMVLSGSLYFPYALLNINNGSNVQTEGIVAGSVNFQGGSQTLQQATSGSQTGLMTPGVSTASMIQ